MLIEHIAREMDVACAVKCLAEARYGLGIEIKHIYLHARENMKKYQPKVVAKDNDIPVKIHAPFYALPVINTGKRAYIHGDRH